MDKKVVKKPGFFSGLVRKPLVLLLLLGLTFWLGTGVGSGRISLPSRGSDYNAAAGLPENLNYAAVDEVYDELRANYDGKLTEEQLITGMKEGLAEATGDPYTEFFTAKEAKDFQGQINNSFSGIGAELGKDKDDNLIIVAPIAGFPAEKAGLKPQDIITTINGESTGNLSIDEAVGKIRGDKGTKVTLEVVRGRTQPLSFTITRDDIKIESVKSEILEGNIGYLTVTTFGTDTADLFTAAANKLKQENVKGIILDLRGNPGGVLDAAVQMSEQWLPAGKLILEEKRGDVVIERYESKGPGQLQGIPTVVLINEGSASASEIMAGALRDNKAARLIGEKSYGKGVVQQPICVGGNSGFGAGGGCQGDMLKVTVASWFRPNGQNINKKGITPDQTVKLTEEDIKAEKDTQKDAAVQYLQSKQ
ncbi:MAG TPA: S41 family peptidase [Candidatus Saccharimonadales bacterium]|nr:S41 family peptidase [Candidatus Saccharimonadales bacterium]